jgi:Tfp pilus assembly protein PilV
MRLAPASRREGFSLLEVLAATTIFLFALVALSQLLQVCSDMAIDTQNTNRAHQLLESKLNEVCQGAVPLQSQGDVQFDEDSAWTYSITADVDGTTSTLYHVTIKVSRTMPTGTFERSITQMVLDPAAKGSLGTTPSGSPATTGGN